MTAWTPAEITTGMVEWFDAADSGTMTFSGSNLTAWTDKSPAANHATPFTTGPTLTSVNGLGTLAFNALGIRTTTAISLGDFTLFVTFTPSSTPTTYERIVDHDFTTGWWIGREVNAASFGGGVKETGAPYGRYRALTNSVTHQLSSKRTGTTHAVAGDGGTAITGTVTGTATTSNVIGIGAARNNTASDRFVGSISEVILWSRALSTDEHQKTEGYLAWKWGIQASLPAGHPYKDAAPTVSGAYTLTADTGARTLSGVTNTLAYARVMPAAQTTVTLGSFMAGLSITSAKVLAAGMGSVALAATDTGLQVARVLPAVTGAIALGGSAAGLAYARAIAAVEGALSLTGTSANLLYDTPNRVMTADLGALILAGSPAQLTHALVDLTPPPWFAGGANLTDPGRLTFGIPHVTVPGRW